MSAWILEDLMPLARLGLADLDIPGDEIDEYLGIVAARVENGQNGAAWQRRWKTLNQGSLQDMVRVYQELQDTNQPVHTWPV
jgi:hypothetical protein